MNTMLRKALRKYNRLRRKLDKVLLGNDGDEYEAELEKFLARRPCWTNGQVAQVTQPKLTSSILKLVSTIVVNATTGKFVAKDKFKLKKDGGICSYLGGNFRAWFLNGDGKTKTEDPITKQTLRCHQLRQSSVNCPIITELGGEAKAETTLSELSSLMEKQKYGESGPLLVNGYTNIFYVRDQNGMLRTVDVDWYDLGWCVGASSVGGPDGWFGGCQVFSRNSVLESSESSAPAQA
ncbi:MAG: hypothetical protein HYV76_00870 [Candidatus Vogelbacteria bacterium]|nr:hypothetical protein [Candidatus Vogelbacteria bacterium]